jgi:hypothetical protein
MSDKTYASLREAISAHVLDEYGEELSLVKDWVLVAGLSDLESVDGLEKIVVHRSEGTSLYAVTGLLTWGAETMDSMGFLGPEDY